MFNMTAATSTTCGQGENLIYFLCDCSKNVLDIPGKVLNFEGTYVRKKYNLFPFKGKQVGISVATQIKNGNKTNTQNLQS